MAAIADALARGDSDVAAMLRIKSDFNLTPPAVLNLLGLMKNEEIPLRLSFTLNDLSTALSAVQSEYPGPVSKAEYPSLILLFLNTLGEVTRAEK